MSFPSNIPKDVQDSIRQCLDPKTKLGIKRLVKQELRQDKIEYRALVFTSCRLYVFTSKVPAKVEHSIHYLDIQEIESKKKNQLTLTVRDVKPLAFVTLEAETEEVNHMITHIGTALKQIFLHSQIERLIKKIDVQPTDRLKTMHDMMRDLEAKESGPCGGYSQMYACMCDYHGLPYRDEVQWDVDTIYLSQDSRELCLRDFDHLETRDLIPVVSALEHNTWFTKLNANNVKLIPEVASGIIHVMKKNAVIEDLSLCNTGIKLDFIQKLATALISNIGTQLSQLDLSNNILEDRAANHIIGSVTKACKSMTRLNLSRTGISAKGIRQLAETMSTSFFPLTLQELDLSNNSIRGEDNMTVLYSYLAQPSCITHLNMSGMDCSLDMLCASLQRGCCKNIVHLNLAHNVFSSKKRDVPIPMSWKQFFSSVCNLKHLDLSGNKLPPDAVKDLLLGIGSNTNLKNLHLDLSSNDLGKPGASMIQSCIAMIPNISSLDISNNVLAQDLKSVLGWIAQNKHIKKLSIGRNFSTIKPKHLLDVINSIVQLVQDENSSIETLSLADSNLKVDTAMFINALGSNTSLIEVDISGNHMGELGAKTLSKALQINTHLRTIYWDKNYTTANGYEDIAEALEKNYTLKKMPTPINDAAMSLRTQPERTEAALQKIESLLQRNHSPRKFASDQAYRLQQGFLISSTQNMVERLVVQVQDTVNALSIKPRESFQSDIDVATNLVVDAENSRQLLPKLQEIAIKSQGSGSPADMKMKSVADQIKQVIEKQMKSTVDDMLKCAGTQCKTIMKDEAFCSELKSGCEQKSSLQKDFTSIILDGVGTDIFNKLSELNLAVAALISDHVIDEVIDNLSSKHKILTNHLNIKKKAQAEQDDSVERNKMIENDQTKETLTIRNREADDATIPKDSPKTETKKTHKINARQRPQSVIDREQVRQALKLFDIALEEAKAAPSPLAGEIDDIVEEAEHDAPTKDTSSLAIIDSTDVPEKLTHITTDRPKRPKKHAITRPMVNIGTKNEENEPPDAGITNFYTTPTIAEVPAAEEQSKPPEKKDKIKKEPSKKNDKKDKGGKTSTSFIPNIFRKKATGDSSKSRKSDCDEPSKHVFLPSLPSLNKKKKENKSTPCLDQVDSAAIKNNDSQPVTDVKPVHNDIHKEAEVETKNSSPKLPAGVVRTTAGSNLMADLRAKQNVGPVTNAKMEKETNNNEMSVKKAAPTSPSRKSMPVLNRPTPLPRTPPLKHEAQNGSVPAVAKTTATTEPEIEKPEKPIPVKPKVALRPPTSKPPIIGKKPLAQPRISRSLQTPESDGNAPEKGDSAKPKQDGSDAKPEMTTPKSDVAGPKLETRDSTELKRESPEGKRDSGDGKRDSSNSKRDSSNSKRDSGDGKRDSGDGKRDSGDGKRDSGEMKAQSSPVRTQAPKVVKSINQDQNSNERPNAIATSPLLRGADPINNDTETCRPKSVIPDLAKKPSVNKEPETVQPRSPTDNNHVNNGDSSSSLAREINADTQLPSDGGSDNEGETSDFSSGDELESGPHVGAPVSDIQEVYL